MADSVDQDAAQTELKASTRPSVSSILPTSNEPETPEQRMGQHRNGAYKEHVSVKQVDQRAEEQRKRTMLLLGLEVALAAFLTVAAKLWSWAQEEQTRARVDRMLRRRISAS